MTEHEYWTLHSPYPDKTWRGIEKCAEIDLSKVYEDIASYNLLLFNTEEEAKTFIKIKQVPWFVPARIIIQTPSVREKFQ